MAQQTRMPIANLKGPQGVRGPQGLPGAEGVPTDQAVAQLVDIPSATKTALDGAYIGKNELVVNVTDYGADPAGVADSTTAIQAAINAAGTGEVFFPAGNYNISKILRPVQGVTLRGYGATLHRKNPTEYTMMKNWPGGDTTTAGYDGIGGVTLLGLTFHAHAEIVDIEATIVNFAHCRDVTIRDCTFINAAGSHAIEVNAVDGVLIEGCTIAGWRTLPGASTDSEGVLIGAATAGSVGGGAPDGTPCINVTVRTSTFIASDEYPAHPVGAGSHGADGGFVNITIDSCTFRGQTIAAVRTMQWNQSSISNCAALDQISGSPFYVRSSKGVTVIGCQSRGDFQGRGVNIDDSLDVMVSGCIIGKANEGIGVQASQHITVTGCQTDQTRSYGLIVNGSQNVSIYGCTFKSPGFGTESVLGVIRCSTSQGALQNVAIVGNRSIGTIAAAGISVSVDAGTVYATGNFFPGLAVVSAGGAITTDPNKV